METDWLKKPYSLNGKKIWVAGHNGLVGSAVVRRLGREGCELLTISREVLDLRDRNRTRDWMAQNKPDVIVLAAAKVGGILANRDYPDEFLQDNLLIQNSVIHSAAELGVEKLLFLGSSCIYPKDAPQPIAEEALMTGALEPTNKAYAIAKIAGIMLCRDYRREGGHDFITVMPCNIYGPDDRFDAQQSHVLAALMMKAHAAKNTGSSVLNVWGTGEPLREFLHADDLADALVFLLQNYSGEAPVNVGSGEEVSIEALAQKICAVTGYNVDMSFDYSKPDGVKRKLLDSSRIMEAGWSPKISLEEGLETTYAWYCEHIGYKDAA